MFIDRFFSVVILAIIFVCSGCSYLNAMKEPSVTVNYAEGFRVGFSGKGAGAGLMLAGSMGPMGIAIGVAIDEGIAKDIRESLLQANIDLDAIVIDSILAAWHKRCVVSPTSNSSDLCHHRNAFLITVSKLDFVVKANDYAVPQYSIGLSVGEHDYSLPTDSLFEIDDAPQLQLDIIKQDGNAAATLFTQYLDRSADVLFAQNNL